MGNEGDTERWPDLLSTLAHELRTEVSAIMHQVELLTTAGGLDESTRRRSLAAIEANTDGLVGLADELTDLDRVVRGDVHPVCRPVRLQELLSSYVRNSPATLRLAPSWQGSEAAAVAYTDPAIVGHIVGSVARRLGAGGIDEPVVTAVADTAEESFVDVILSAEPPAGCGERVDDDARRPVTLADGLALFVAHKLAESIGGRLGVVGSGRSRAYALRLPASGRPA